MTKANLRAVKANEKPARPMTLVEAIESGDYRQILMAQRRDIAASLPDEKGPAKAALHRQLAIISKEIEELDAALDEEQSVVVRSDDEAFDGTGY